MFGRLHITLVCLLLSAASTAAEVLSVGDGGKTLAISQSKDTGGFKVRDYLCVVDDDEEIACGVVIRALPKGAILRVDYVKGSISRGDRVQFAGGRYPAAVAYSPNSSLEVPAQRRRKYPFDISGGVLGGANYLIPMVHFQGMVTHKTALGVQPVYFRQTVSSTDLFAYGAFFTWNYYTSGYFRGFWFSGGAGLYSFNATPTDLPTERTVVPAVLTSIGYRFGLGRGVNIGIALAAQYLKRPRLESLDFNFSEYQGIGTIDLGFNF